MYWSVDGGKGAAMGVFLDPAKLGGQRIFYVLVVCSKTSGEGIGAALIRAIVQYARTAKASKVWLASLTRPLNFYRREGFVPGPWCAHEAETMKSLGDRVIPQRGRFMRGDRNSNEDKRRIPNRFFAVLGLGGWHGADHYNGAVDGYLMTRCLH